MENPLTDLDESEDPPRRTGASDEKLGRDLGIQTYPNTQYTRELICIKGYYVQDKVFLVLVQSDPDTLKRDQCHR